jgi:hypothetical protein
MIQLLTNARLAAHTVLQHLTDDPVVLSLQLSRRLPASIVHPAARLVCAVSPKNSLSVPVLLASLTLGDEATSPGGSGSALTDIAGARKKTRRHRNRRESTGAFGCAAGRCTKPRGYSLHSAEVSGMTAP